MVPYLTLEAFRATIAMIARLGGSGVDLDYGQPREALPLTERLARDVLAARVRMAGEPFWLFTPDQIAEELSNFRQIEDSGSAEVSTRYFSERRDRLGLKGSSGRMLCAWR